MDGVVVVMNDVQDGIEETRSSAASAAIMEALRGRQELCRLRPLLVRKSRSDVSHMSFTVVLTTTGGQ